MPYHAKVVDEVLYIRFRIKSVSQLMTHPTPNPKSTLYRRHTPTPLFPSPKSSHISITTASNTTTTDEDEGEGDTTAIISKTTSSA